MNPYIITRQQFMLGILEMMIKGYFEIAKIQWICDIASILFPMFVLVFLFVFFLSFKGKDNFLKCYFRKYRALKYGKNDHFLNVGVLLKIPGQIHFSRSLLESIYLLCLIEFNTLS